MPFVKRRPQPPGDDGTRGNLADRKGKIDNVEYAYPAIVNVYALRPKDSSGNILPISLSDFTSGFFSDLPVYSQSNKRIGKVNGSMVAQVPASVEPEKIGFEWSKHAGGRYRRPELYMKKGGVASKDFGTLTADQYEAIMTSPSAEADGLIRSYDLNDYKDMKKIRRAMFEVHKKVDNPTAHKNIIYHEARRLQVPMRQIVEWAKNPALSLDAFKKRQGDKAIAQRESDINYLVKEIVDNSSDNTLVIRNKNVLRSSYGLTDDDINVRIEKRKESIKPKTRKPESVIPLPSSQPQATVVVSRPPIRLEDTGGMISPTEEQNYMPINAEEAESVGSKKGMNIIKYKKGRNNEIIYYAPLRAFEESRRRKLRKMRVKRYKVISKSRVVQKKKASNRIAPKHILKKPSKSSTMKKKILNSIRCKCKKKGRR